MFFRSGTVSVSDRFAETGMPACAYLRLWRQDQRACPQVYGAVNMPGKD